MSLKACDSGPPRCSLEVLGSKTTHLVVLCAFDLLEFDLRCGREKNVSPSTALPHRRARRADACGRTMSV
jgi:hypothetical protein